MDPLSIGVAGAGFLANLYGQQKAAKEMREAGKLVDSQIADLTSWKDIETNRPYLESNLGRNLITKVFDKYRDTARTAKSTAAVTGASDEAVIAQQAGAADALGNVMSDVAAQGAAREDSINQQYRSTLANLLAQKMGLIQGRAQSGANLATSAGALLTGVAPMMGGEQGALKGLDQFGRTAEQNGALTQIAASA